MTWTTLNFGKHDGKSLPQVLFSDPDWFFWAIEKDAFRDRGDLEDESKELYQKARNIKIPNNDDGSLIVQHYIHRPTGKYSHFEIIPENQPQHEGASPTIRNTVLDMTAPRNIGSYDKIGYKSLVSSLKSMVFGSKSARMSKSKIETFFDDRNNFL